MGATNSTTNFHFPLFISSDVPAWMTDWNNAMNSIDSALQTIKGTAESASGTAGTASTKAEQASNAVETIQSSVTALQGTVSSLGTTVDSLQSTYALLNSQVQIATSNIQTLQGQMSSVQSQSGNNATTLATNAWTSPQTVNITKAGFTSGSSVSSPLTVTYNPFLKLLSFYGWMGKDQSTEVAQGDVIGILPATIPHPTAPRNMTAFAVGLYENSNITRGINMQVDTNGNLKWYSIADTGTNSISMSINCVVSTEGWF